MSEVGMFEVHAIQFVGPDDERVTDEFKAQDQDHAYELARSLSRVSEYVWTEVQYMGGSTPQRVKVYVKGRTVLGG
jgi:hypothetical protein